ncbi:MAG: HK97 family phage prohead protease [Oscillospiraceae bacterium]|nr:HK97 family phage prohead protease [Oscillospiraceae bacterium]MBP0987916.1 HK97 family phage prohead protease [Oscillospiraceae bacterium]MBQ5339348.1 HK97 family phage prohead protease [Oscillospiraceae bacterium]
MKTDREFRKCAEFRAMDDADSYVVEGYATTFDQPYTLYSDGYYELREVVDSHAFDKTDMSDVIMQYDHEGRVFARNRNKTLDLTTDEHGLKITANLGGTDIGRQLYQEIKGGYTDRMSFAFTVSDDKRERETIDGKIVVTRRILGFRKLYDVSAVSTPANNSTSISARSFVDGVIAELEAERLSALEYSKRKLALKIKLSGGK